jgi:hypothetical protein
MLATTFGPAVGAGRVRSTSTRVAPGLMTINLIYMVRNAHRDPELPMTVLLAVGAWMVVVVLVAGLCAAAQRGDHVQYASAESLRTEPTVWESFEHAEIIARANARTGDAVESGSSLLHGDGVAA